MRYIAGSILIASMSATGTLYAYTSETEMSADQAQMLIKEFATTLQGELKGALKEGGPIGAVQVCKERAPAIAESLSEQSGWEIGRTSLKTRNAETNTPDAWETEVLKQFADRVAAGQSIKTMTYAEVVETDTGKAYRYMKAIPTGEICLACHGVEIDPKLAEAIDKAYPEDSARGYSAGELRGAFTLSKPL
ncbi:MAG: DUF3365 domain-containing protein [Thiohalocapsa sp.]|nr:DUF3365 domain-containing protein [Thiohalocapsa sp.]MCF7992962.1 DUF3365 domain-containing protein [Thiohalocapsa sp.]